MRHLAFSALLLVMAASLCSCASHKATRVAKPSILSREQWEAQPPVARMKPHKPTLITIHHTGVTSKPALSLAEKLRGLQQFSQKPGKLGSGKDKPAWPDVPYHFYISCDGQIAGARDVRFAGDTNTEYDPTGHILIVLEGNFEIEEPTAAQMQSARRLVAWLAARYRVAPHQIRSHKDYASTLCPGKHLYERLSEIRE